MSKPKSFEEQLAIDVRFDPSTQHSELISGRKSKRTFKGFLTKYFLEGQQHYSTVRCHEGSSWHERHRNIIAFCLPFCFFQMCWWTLAIRYNLFRLYKTHYAMPITMIFGAFISGATSEGGGAVAFPVMTLLLNLPPTAARDFSLMIQSCVWELFFSVILSLQYGDDVLTSSEKKMMFVAIWFAFAIALLILNFERKRTTYDSIPEFCFWKGVVLFFTGIIGGEWMGRIEVYCLLRYSYWIDGLRSGHNFVLHSNVNVFDFRKNRNTNKRRTHVDQFVGWLLLATFDYERNFRIGISVLVDIWYVRLLQTLNWPIVVPVVVTCSPAGAFVASHLHRQTLAFMVYILETISLIGFLLTQPKFTLLLVGCVIVIAHIFIFFALSKLGKLIVHGLTVEKKQESPRTKQIITKKSNPEDQVSYQLPYAIGIYDPEKTPEIIFERFRESLQFEGYTEQQIRSMIVGMQILNGWSNAYNVIVRMIHMERRMTTRYVAYKIVNIYALQFDRHQRFKKESTNYQSHFPNQRLLFLMNDPDELANNLMNGMTPSAAGTKCDLGSGFYFTENIECLFPLWKRRDERDYQRRVYVPIAAVALGNMKTYRDISGFAPQSGVPAGYDSVCLTGVFGAPYYNYLRHKGIRFRYPVDEFQLNHLRIQMLEYTNFYVVNTQQVRICYLVELEWCDKNKISWFDENM
ncbi:hypothetical protein M3Y98_00988500 [Aphelenchoides besseyi]|nr:hypothetical protein M3Y98_00988500 [Aphelenchoides besseyi]